MLKIQALELFNVSNVDAEETDGDTLKELVEILQEQQKNQQEITEALKAELDIKNEQIRALNTANSQQLQLIDQQQKLQAIAETKRIESKADPITHQESLLNREKFSTEAEYQQYLLKLLPRIGMFSNRFDLKELDKVLEMMSEYERKLVFRDKRAKEAIEHIKGMDFDQLEKELAEAEKESEELREKNKKAMQEMREQMERERAERLNNIG